MTTNGTLTTLFSFSTNSGAYTGDLTQASDGSFYGTTSGGGVNGNGTVFQISTNGALTSLYSFGSVNDGANPSDSLVQGSDGYFYGTASYGGTNDNGTVFKISASGALTSLYSFTGGDDGSLPYAGLVQGSDGNFYGTTDIGIVFKISTNGVLARFGAINDGWVNEAGLVQGSDGNFYGTTSGIGAHVRRNGTVFRLTIVPEFQAVTLTNSTMNLTWSTEAGGRYQLQWNSDLSSSNWTNLRGPVTAAGATLIATDSVTNAPRRFYRLVLSP